MAGTRTITDQGGYKRVIGVATMLPKRPTTCGRCGTTEKALDGPILDLLDAGWTISWNDRSAICRCPDCSLSEHIVQGE